MILVLGCFLVDIWGVWETGICFLSCIDMLLGVWYNDFMLKLVSDSEMVSCCYTASCLLLATSENVCFWLAGVWVPGIISSIPIHCHWWYHDCILIFLPPGKQIVIHTCASLPVSRSSLLEYLTDSWIRSADLDLPYFYPCPLQEHGSTYGHFLLLFLFIHASNFLFLLGTERFH